VNDETQVSGRKVFLAGQFLWTAIRASQFLLVVFFAKAVYLNYHTPAFTEMLWSGILFVVLFLLIPCHAVSTGWADTSGLHYRRYFWLHTLPWIEVKEIRWRGNRLRIVRKKKDFLLNRVVFLLNPFGALPGYFGQRLGGEAALPEVIEKLLAIPKEEEVLLVTSPPVAKWMLRAFAGFALFFFLIVLLKLVLASLH
jgi:hypothetical protein